MIYSSIISVDQYK